jgi:hypothetical protein
MVSEPTRIVACPQCKKSVSFDVNNKWRPFCSERCRLIDLGAWANESHRIAGETLEEAKAKQNRDDDL